jgi:D-alanine-D-alanine ligase
MRIALLIDPECVAEEDPQLENGYGKVAYQVEFHITETLRHQGHVVVVLAFEADAAKTINALTAIGPDLVFNLTEHVGGDRKKDQLIASILELLDVPYTGAGPTGLMLCRDKTLCKQLLSHHRVPVPRFVQLAPGRTAVPTGMQYPIIVKPGFEDGSDGISLASRVHNADELRARVEVVHERMKQPAICEEFIGGREIYVGITGNERLTAYPAREVKFSKAARGPQFATSRVKLDESYRKKWKVRFTDARLSGAMEQQAARISKQVYRILQLRDYGRIDMRLTPEGRFVVLEANPNPDLSMGDELAEAAEKAGVPFVTLIQRIVRHALKRQPAP